MASARSLFRFGLVVGLRTVPVAPRHGLKRLILPLDYIRYAEDGYVLEHLDVRPGHLVLDVGSPKLLSLFLAARTGARVHATDLLGYFFGAYGAYADRMLGAHRDRYVMRTEDARALRYRDETFDRGFSISAIEHIPGDGDRIAMREIARVLKPGGLCCVTVPWSDRGYVEEFKRRGDPDAYWAGSDAERVFYQRAYDRTTLEDRLLSPSGLEVVDVSFWGERWLPAERLFLSRQPLRYAMLPLHFPLALLCLARLGEREPSRKKVACLTLRRPTAGQPGRARICASREAKE
ncbi:MAG: class I SAM-dependent methyltransferase [Candidatus Rokubacteria bacterium]|nr:class I SAM-dependent methyltransferase [Candidatus Rokubacteria bacterium]